jgi:hypothetical protein
MVNTSTSAIKKEDIVKIVSLSKHELNVMDFSELAPAATTQ